MRARANLLTWSILGLLLLLAVVAVSSGGQAADRDIYGDWVIGAGTTHVVEETIDVRGNVTVQSGGVLKLENCTLSINASENGQYGMRVGEGGKLEAYGTVMEGLDARVTYRFHDDVVIEGCEIRHIHGSASTVRGVIFDGGTALLKDTVVSDSNYYGLYLQTDTTLDNVTISDTNYASVYIYNWGMSSAATITVRNSDLQGSGGSSWWLAGILAYTFSQGEQVDLLVQDTTFHNQYRGFYASSSGKLSATVERCTFTQCTLAIAMSTQASGGSFDLRNNVVGPSTKSGSVGMALTMRSGVTLTMLDNEVSHVGSGYVLTGPWSGRNAETLTNIEVHNCTRGFVADRGLDLTVRDCRAVDISDSFGCFVSINGSTITVIDTEHAWGSGSVTGNGWIRAYKDMEVLGAKWEGGGPIREGSLVIENFTQYEVARFNLSDLRTQDVVGWEADSSGTKASRYLYPALYIEGHGFRGDRFDIKEYVPTVFELVDDAVPIASIDEPSEDEGYNRSTIVATGRYQELGSGMSLLEYSLDGGAFISFTNYFDGDWTQPLVDLPEGDHELRVRATDRAGNVAEPVAVSFLVDTVVPHIDLDPVEALVNTSSVIVSGGTEPNVTLRVQGREVGVDAVGGFATNVALKEGSNTIVVEATDQARNYNTSHFSVESDTIAPDLVISAPEDYVWTNLRRVKVEGLTEAFADLRVMGSYVPVVNGTFSKTVELSPGDFTINVTSADRAGNVARANITLRVDWTPPGLVIVQPEELVFYTKDSSLYITGDVDDPTIYQATINGLPLELTSGRFVKQFTLLEGENVFFINVTDAAGNTNGATVQAIKDLSAPTYDVELEAEGGELIHRHGVIYSTAMSVEAHVTLNEQAVAKLEDGTELPMGDEFRIRFDLEEGVNSIELTFVDRAGNRADPYGKQIIVDTTEPSITLFEPRPGARTKDDTTVIHGQTEEGSQVTINGGRVDLLSEGEFRLTVALVKGVNEFTIEVEDPMGNTNTTKVTVVRDVPVKAEEESSLGWILGGFVGGLVVGAIIGIAFMALQGRERPEREAPAPERPVAPRATAREPKAPAEPEEDKGWEEF